MTQLDTDKPFAPPAELLEQYLADRDVPCPRCGYNLRSLMGRRCPECGDELTLQVGLVEPRHGPYMTALAASCAGVGGSGLFCMIGLSAAPSSWWEEPAAITLLIMLIVSTALLAAVLLKRRAFRIASPKVQWILAGIASLLVAVLGVLVVVLFKD